jgi:antitoxin YefM
MVTELPRTAASTRTYGEGGPEPELCNTCGSLATSVSGGSSTRPRWSLDWLDRALIAAVDRTGGIWSEIRLAWSILLTMSIAATPVPLSEAKARLSELVRRVRQQHERIALTRNGEAEAVLLSVDDLEGLEMTLEILGDADAAARISESLAALERGEPGADMATVRQDLARRRSTGR